MTDKTPTASETLFTVENLQNLRAIVESGTPLARNTVLRLIEHARAHLASAQPMVTSMEELDALKVGAVIRTEATEQIVEKMRHSPYLPYWIASGEDDEASMRDLLPARVLYRPEVDE
ncbi:hypothetical protein ACT17S_00485 [Glutamicibacter mysorens]